VIKQAFFFALIAGIFLLVISIQSLVSIAFMDLMAVLIFVMVLFAFVGIIDMMFIRRRR
jgi:hypothetical protein